MTTTEILYTGPVPADYARRPVPIAADLLPAEVVEHRRGRAARKVVLTGLAGLLVLSGAWYGGSLYQTSTARESLASAVPGQRPGNSQSVGPVSSPWPGALRSSASLVMRVSSGAGSVTGRLPRSRVVQLPSRWRCRVVSAVMSVSR